MDKSRCLTLALKAVCRSFWNLLLTVQSWLGSAKLSNALQRGIQTSHCFLAWFSQIIQCPPERNSMLACQPAKAHEDALKLIANFNQMMSSINGRFGNSGIPNSDFNLESNVCQPIDLFDSQPHQSPAVKAQAAQAPNSSRVPRRSQSETPEGVKAKTSIPAKVGEAKWIDGNV